MCPVLKESILLEYLASFIFWFCYHCSESASFLKENFCRRAGDGLAPWCYTDEDQCSRDYCDVCNLGRYMVY